MFHAWRLVKQELILNTNKCCVDSEKTSALNWLKEGFIIVMFYAWRPVKQELILNTNKFCVDSEKTSAEVVFC